ncbi:class I SAM-dependent methyltransferase [Flavobacterium sp.]|uniref:class I SAM-dependent methyltransferase n=1 Tax=Flavobacterium sp. TaxID=239 RepID=UPI00260D6F7E|nr:class I SAM-dependent methyltransferase [Flavobacterium sp.]
MKIENKDFWEKDTIIKTQEVLKQASDFEMFMFEKAKIRYQSKVDSIKIFGCGTGREIESIADFYQPSRIVASDISENMISKCQENLKLWNIDSITETVVGDATLYNKETEAFDLVTILNSMLTYVPLRKNRLTIFKNSFQILKPKATLIGTVHNQVGSPAKTYYFKLRNLFSFILGERTGNRNTGFNGFKVPGYYYNKKGLIKDLKVSGFENIEVYSLEEYYKLHNAVYNRKTGYNNLIFIATKP